MKNSMKLLVSDNEMDIVQVALAREKHDRDLAIRTMANEGHITILPDMDEHHIRVQIEDEVFTDPRIDFPTIQLMARLQLARHAGRSERLNGIESYHAADAMGYAAIWYDEIAGDFLHGVTATVKKLKGLRP